jgi:hypothetical protein
MTKKLIVILIMVAIFSTNVHAKTNPHIEIIDVSKGEIVEKVPLSPKLQNYVEKFLKGISGVYKKMNPVPSEGHIVKVPLEPNVALNNQWLNTIVDEVILIFTGSESPYLCVFDDENRTYFFTFKGETNEFLNELNFK